MFTYLKMSVNKVVSAWWLELELGDGVKTAIDEGKRVRLWLHMNNYSRR